MTRRSRWRAIGLALATFASTLALVVGVGPAAPPAKAATSPCGAHGVQTIDSVGIHCKWQKHTPLPGSGDTSGIQDTYTVPKHATKVRVVASSGGFTEADLAVTPGQLLQVNVGGFGQDPDFNGSEGGWNGGGRGGHDGFGYSCEFVQSTSSSRCGSGGDGATDIRTSPYGLNERVIVAGGDGGSGTGGGLSGHGGGSEGPYYNGGGGAANQLGGGGGGGPAGSGGGDEGTFGQGGAGGIGVPFIGKPAVGGGGGGGGWLGGGGGSGRVFILGVLSYSAGGGGGGSGHLGAGTSGGRTLAGAGNGHYAEITYYTTPTTTTLEIEGNGATGQSDENGTRRESGQTLTLNARVVYDGSTLSTVPVTFYDGDTVLGTASLQSVPGQLRMTGVATFTAPALTTGLHTYKATFDGDGTLLGSEASKNVTGFTNDHVASTLSLSVSPTTTAGDADTVHATWTSNEPGHYFFRVQPTPCSNRNNFWNGPSGDISAAQAGSQITTDLVNNAWGPGLNYVCLEFADTENNQSVAQATVTNGAPNVTITNTNPTTVPAGGSSTISWNANKSGAYAVRIGGTTCSDAPLATGGSNITGTYLSGTVNSVVTEPNLRAQGEAGTTVRVCVTAPSGTGSATTTVTDPVPVVTFTQTPTPSTLTYSQTSDHIETTGSTTFRWRATKNGSYEIRTGGSSCETATLMDEGARSGGDALSGGYDVENTKEHTVQVRSYFAPGVTPIRVCITDSDGRLGEGVTTVTKVNGPAHFIGPNPSAGTAYAPYSFQLNAGTSPTTFTLSGGSLPAGLTLSPSGLISGAPTAVGTSTFTVQAAVTDQSTGHGFATKQFSIVVGKNQPSVTVTPSPRSSYAGTSVTLSADVTMAKAASTALSGFVIFKVNAQNLEIRAQVGDWPADATLTYTPPAGTYSVTAEYVPGSAIEANVLEASSPADLFQVNPKLAQAALSATGPSSGVYGDILTFNLAGGSGSGAQSIDVDSSSTACTKAGGTTETLKVAISAGTGTCSIKVHKDGDSDHLSADATKSVTVSKKPLTITPSSGQRLEYGQSPELIYTHSGLAPGDVDGNVFSGKLSTSGSDVGTWPITLGTLSAGDNYAIALSSTTVNLEIVPKPILVRPARGQTKITGASDPVITYVHAALGSGDTDSVFSGALGREPGEDPGAYPITIGTLSAGGNYTLNLISYDFTIGDPHLYIAKPGRTVIKRVDADGTNAIDPFVSDVGDLSQAATDGTYLYTAEGATNTIGRARLDGRDTPDHSFIQTSAPPVSVAVHGDYVFWASTAGVGRALKNGTGTPDNSFIAGLGFTGVAATANGLYLTKTSASSSESASVSRAPIGGGAPTTLFTLTDATPQRPIVSSDTLYWVNNFSGSIGRATLTTDGDVESGSVDESFITGASFPTSVAVGGAYIYWSHGSGIGRADLDGDNVDQTFLEGSRVLAAPGVTDLLTVGQNNLALGATATTPHRVRNETTENASKAIDGDPTTKWVSDDDQVAEKSMTIDLGSVRTITGFTVRHAGSGGEDPARNTRDFKFLTSTDNSTFTEVHRHRANTADVSQHVIGSSVEARYVKFVSTHATNIIDATDPNVPNGTVRIYEIEVFGSGSGIGTGTVTSSPSGVDCGTDCVLSLGARTPVTLTATPAAGSSFAGWSGACTGTGECTLTMKPDVSVNAAFTGGGGGDTTAPTATIARADGQTSPTTTSPVSFAVTFSESVTGFEADDIELTGDAGHGTPSVTGSGVAYTVSVPVTSAGVITASVKAGAAEDTASNPSTASGSASVTYTVTTEYTVQAKDSDGTSRSSALYGERLALSTAGGDFSGPSTFTVASGSESKCTIESSDQLVIKAATGSCVVEAVRHGEIDGSGAVETDTLELVLGKAPLTVDAENKQVTYGGTKPAFTVSYDGLVLGDDKNDLGGTLTFTGNATSATNAGTYSIVPTGLTSSNYNIAFESGTLTINKKATTVSATNQTKTYGSDNPALTATVSGNLNGDTINYTLSTTAQKFSGVAGSPYPIKVNLGSNPNYSVSGVDGALTVTRKAATVTANNQSKTYGADNPVPSAVVTGAVNGDVLSFSLAHTAGKYSSVGSHPIRTTLGSNPNYAVTAVDGVLSVAKRAASITANDKSKVYGSDNPPLTATVAGTINGDSLAYTLSTTAQKYSGVSGSPYPINVTLGSNPNYSVTTTSGKLTVTKKKATVQSLDATKIYGSDNPAFAALVSGSVNGDIINFSLSTPAQKYSGVSGSPYPINVTLGSNPNYDVTTIIGKLTVTKRSATVKANDITRNFGSSTPPLSATVTGTVNNDVLNYTLSTPATTSSGIQGSPYAISIALGSNPNYNVTTTGAKLTIIATCANPGPKSINGGAGSEILNGTAGNDVIFGNSGNDTINGLGGTDLLCGGEGGDSINGGDGNDMLEGGNGDDLIKGVAGNDSIAGDAGIDVIEGGVGDDKITGGVGNDTLKGIDGNDWIQGGDGNDGIDGGNHTDTCFGDAGSDTAVGCETKTGVP